MTDTERRIQDLRAAAMFMEMREGNPDVISSLRQMADEMKEADSLMSSQRIEYRVVISEARPAWAIEYRTSDLETWSRMPFRFLDKATADAKLADLEAEGEPS